MNSDLLLNMNLEPRKNKSTNLSSSIHVGNRSLKRRRRGVDEDEDQGQGLWVNLVRIAWNCNLNAGFLHSSFCTTSQSHLI